MSLFDQLLDYFSAAAKQNDRLLKLYTPLGRNVLLAERAEVAEAIGPTADPATEDDGPNMDFGTGLRIVVHALAPDTHIELKTLVGQCASLELLTQLSRSELRPWHGHITHAALLGSDGGLARYRLVIEPWLSFLAHTQDSWVFQNQTVPQIIEEIFADYAGQGSLVPAWRWDLQDASVYPQRSLCIQYQESDLAFVQRLLREEGLFYWFEHTADGHTMVIADHNEAFKPGAQSLVRYTQSGSALPEDSITRWRRSARVRSSGLNLASPDYRNLGMRANSQSANSQLPGSPASLQWSDVPGSYAYEDAAQGQRLALRQMQAIDSWRLRVRGIGSLRTAAPATLFTLCDHPVHDGSTPQRDQFVILSVVHQARSNLSASHKAQVESLLGAILRDQSAQAPKQANQTDEPLYQCTIDGQPAMTAVRPAMADPSLNCGPTVQGVQTALVVGLSEPLHTDRDHRIKVQFHWQRGEQSSHRLSRLTGDGQDNAPASDASGTWVRVSEALAGANWGSNFTPRLGQEVLISFIGGDVDRPVVVGSLYNGLGQDNAPGNAQAAGSAGATGNANAWFPGSQAAGDLQGHQHAAVLLGHKSQELSASSGGTGGYNQLVVDDSPGQSRMELSSTTAATRLQLGHLLNQNDNQRLEPRGHGADLQSSASGALRAGQGLLLSTYGQAGSLSGSLQLDSRAAINQLGQATDLTQALADNAQKQNAVVAGSPATLPTLTAWSASATSLKTIASSAATDEGSASSIGGGAGQVAAWSRPDLVLTAPAGVVQLTPASTVMSAGNTISLSANQDIAHLAQGNMSSVSKDGLVFYTVGKATDAQKPNQETGIKMHAASGSVNTQSQTGATKLTADQAIQVASANDAVTISAPQSVLLTAAGAAIKIEAGKITLSGPGKVEFKAGMKELTSGVDARTPGLELATAALTLPRSNLLVHYVDAYDEHAPGDALGLKTQSGETHSIASGTSAINNFKKSLASLKANGSKE